MAIAHASTPAAPLSAKIPQVTGQKKNGKNWHENKAAFRPGTGHTSYAKRTEKQKQEAEVKKMEKEMKDEKEQERQVCSNHSTEHKTVSCAYVHGDFL
jgi:rRNA-processing protein CGR1